MTRTFFMQYWHSQTPTTTLSQALATSSQVYSNNLATDSQQMNYIILENSSYRPSNNVANYIEEVNRKIVVIIKLWNESTMKSYESFFKLSQFWKLLWAFSSKKFKKKLFRNFLVKKALVYLKRLFLRKRFMLYKSSKASFT